MMDANQRRAFYCQESLWQAFTNLAIQRSTTVDALINEAMAYFLQGSGGVMNGMDESRGASNLPVGSGQNYPGSGMQNYPPQPPNNYNSSIPAPPVRQSYGGGVASSPLGARVPPPTPPSPYRRPPSLFEESPADAARKPMVLASLQNNPAPSFQPPQPAYNSAPPSAQSQQPLYIVFAGQRYTVDKDKYIIGRSSQLADLVIRDANISRKHCAVIYKNGAYYIKDLDSTNGIEYKGNRIDTKRIDEGDQFNICDFNFTFTYR